MNVMYDKKKKDIEVLNKCMKLKSVLI